DPCVFERASERERIKTELNSMESTGRGSEIGGVVLM
ncbi:hypothetical protein A2U01_0074736, partial [Trifolium medium]|nr:hypothetical protein [Trifolium medium]